MRLNLPLVLTLAAPAVAWAGIALDLPWLFWLGFAFCVVVFHLDYASGAVRGLPILPLICVISGAFWAPTWYVGAAKGFVVWMTLNAFGEVFGHLAARRAVGRKGR